MCGICGVVSTESKPPLSEVELTVMRDSLLHRGPDDAGNYLAPGVALGVRRLAILDLSDKGHMPMASEDGRYRIIYNGEIYNFQSLREELIRRGIRFHSGTDTEVILNLYALEGPEMLNRLNGMFAIAIWDNQERRLFLGRDRLGVKPLYYVSKDDRLYFASEEKAFFAAGIPAKFDSANLEELTYFHYIAGERTPYAGIKRLLPGHYLIWQQGKIKISRWWNLAQKARQAKEEISKNPEEWLRNTFDDAVKIRRISDVPLGVFLSGGLDSGSVAASMAREGSSPVSAFTIRFNESDYDEGPLAQAVAGQYRMNHHELKVPLAKIIDHLTDAARFLDEPMVHASDIHLWMIAAYAKDKVTVLLSGEGADETMAGYGWYHTYRLLPALQKFRSLINCQIIQKLHPKLQKLHQILSLDLDLQKMLRNFSDHLPADLIDFGIPPLKGPFEYRLKVLREAEGLYPQDLARQAMYYDQHTYLCSILDRNDKMTMATSVECRTPFLDYRLVEGLASLPSKVLFQGPQNKSLLRRALGSRLPPAILKGRKKGFDVPWTVYMRQNSFLKEQILQLPEHPVWKSLTLDRKKMENAISGFFKGNDTYARLIRHLLMMTLWHDVCIQGKRA
ncbi:MAG: asparagine synthase (glutamine-hydrolyzing) [Candidatus Omnitrophica bacterium]|nr:asparagine synthase (glutamine-hydrolyzing) [Candidatus Omnitrophota bacterium]